MARKGRPTKKAKPGTRASLGLKVTASLKAHLEREAERSGRTQSQEAEHRLEQSFERQNTRLDMLSTRYSPQIAGMAALLAEVIQQAAAHATARVIAPMETEIGRVHSAWVAANRRPQLENPFVFGEVKRAVDKALDRRLKPNGVDAPPMSVPGWLDADGVVDSVFRELDDAPDGLVIHRDDTFARIKELLGGLWLNRARPENQNETKS